MKMRIHTPPNEKPITELFVVASVDEAGNEGICATGTDRGMMPLVVAYSRLLPMLRTEAQLIAKLTGRKVKLLRLTAREDMEDFEP